MGWRKRTQRARRVCLDDIKSRAAELQLEVEECRRECEINAKAQPAPNRPLAQCAPTIARFSAEAGKLVEAANEARRMFWALLRFFCVPSSARKTPDEIFGVFEDLMAQILAVVESVP